MSAIVGPAAHTSRLSGVSTRRGPRRLGLRDVEGRAVITVEEAASLIGVGRSAAYEAARRGELPIRRVGRRLLVPVPALLQWLGHGPLRAEGDGPQDGRHLAHAPRAP